MRGVRQGAGGGRGARLVAGIAQDRPAEGRQGGLCETLPAVWCGIEGSVSSTGVQLSL